MKGTTAIAAISTVLACSLAGCDRPSDPAERMSRKDPGAPGKPPQALERRVAPSAGAGQAPATAGSRDSALSEKVKTALQTSTEVQTDGLDVAASDGVVTLNGTVQAPREKQRAALLAMNVEGVRSVVNNLVVMSGSS